MRASLLGSPLTVCTVNSEKIVGMSVLCPILSGLQITVSQLQHPLVTWASLLFSDIPGSHVPGSFGEVPQKNK